MPDTLSSRYITDLLEDAPTSITWLDKVADLQPLSAGALKAEITSLLSRHEDSADAMRAVRYLRRREILRIAMGGRPEPAERAAGMHRVGDRG